MLALRFRHLTYSDAHGRLLMSCRAICREGVAYDRVVGFEELGGKDDFETSALESRMLVAGIVEPKVIQPDQEAQNEFDAKRSVYSRPLQLGSDDEDSDFD